MKQERKMGRAICTFLISAIIGVGLSFFNPVWGVTAVACIVGSVIDGGEYFTYTYDSEIPDRMLLPDE